MKNVRLLCLAAILCSAFLGARVYIQEANSPRFDLSKSRAEIMSIENREELMARVDTMLSVLEKGDERIHEWRGLTARAWGSGAFMMAMILLATFVWNNEPELQIKIAALEEEINA